MSEVVVLLKQVLSRFPDLSIHKCELDEVHKKQLLHESMQEQKLLQLKLGYDLIWAW